MNFDEFAFVNQQLAGMLRSGIPLEEALRQLSRTMRQGKLRSELQQLEADLAQGVPLPKALDARHLPPIYVELMKVGVQGNNLPGVLTLAGDYYQRMNLAWTRLKSLLVYPLIVLVMAFALSIFVGFLYSRFVQEAGTELLTVMGPTYFSKHLPAPMAFMLGLWLPVGFLGMATLLVLLGLTIPKWRSWLRWRIPAFKEAGLAQLASSMALMLEQGCSADRALALLAQLHASDPMSTEIGQWRTRLAAGQKNLADLASGGKLVPPLFVWLVASCGEDWIAGFKHAAEIFHARSVHRLELMLYAVLPVSVLILGLLILSQAAPATRLLVGLMQGLSDGGGGLGD